MDKVTPFPKTGGDPEAQSLALVSGEATLDHVRELLFGRQVREQYGNLQEVQHRLESLEQALDSAVAVLRDEADERVRAVELRLLNLQRQLESTVANSSDTATRLQQSFDASQQLITDLSEAAQASAQSAEAEWRRMDLELSRRQDDHQITVERLVGAERARLGMLLQRLAAELIEPRDSE